MFRIIMDPSNLTTIAARRDHSGSLTRAHGRNVIEEADGKRDITE